MLSSLAPPLASQFASSVRLLTRVALTWNRQLVSLRMLWPSPTDQQLTAEPPLTGEGLVSPYCPKDVILLATATGIYDMSSLDAT